MLTLDINSLHHLNVPHQLNPPYEREFNSPLSPSTTTKLPPSIIPPPPQPSTLPPSNDIQLLPPSIVSSTFPLLNDPLTPPTMLITTFLIPLPPSFFTLSPTSSVLPLTLSLPHITCYRMSESIGLEPHQFPPLFECAQSIYRQWPSGATVVCLSRVCCDVIVHAARGQHAQQYLHRTV